MMFYRWRCRDRRYLIRLAGSQDEALTEIDSRCLWYKNYSLTPSDLECVISYCDNATLDPNTNGLNYNFTGGFTLFNLSDTIIYPCNDNFSLEGDFDWKENSTNETEVVCGADGEFIYPSTWTQCSKTVYCPDPGNSTNISRIYISSRRDLEYLSEFQYTCDDPRQWIRRTGQDDTQLSSYIRNKCLWRKSFQLDGTTFECKLHHCSHPHNHPGSHPPPPPQYNISLVPQSNWDTAFTTGYVRYRCDANTFIENQEDDPTQTEIKVYCINVIGEYNTPVRQGSTWPNCTNTVLCGQPPDPPVNGSITWLSPSQELDESYNTMVVYHCQDGSQFDTDGDGYGDSVNITIRCLWSKVWSPHPSLPPCKITHCVEPFKIPEETNLEEVTADWTEVDDYKHYQCKNKVGDNPTMFWESDRSKSSFKLYCRDDGYFTWEEWPICLEGTVILLSTIFVSS